MDYDTACETRFSPKRVMNELSRNGFDSLYLEQDGIVETYCHAVDADGSRHVEIAHFAIGADGKISGKEVLDWLGY